MIARKGAPRVAEWKIKEVNRLVNNILRYNVIGITRMDGLASKQIQDLRKNLKKVALLYMSKNTLMKLALDKAAAKKKGVNKLKEFIEGSAAFLFTNDNPFKISLFLQKHKTKAPIKAGEIAPNDIIVPAGDTGLAPGPAISELHSVGIPTKIERGTIHVEKDTVVAKKGEVVSDALAAILKRLNVLPKEVGLILTVAFENGIIIPSELLNRELDEYINDVKLAVQEAFNLAFNATIITDETAKPILQKAYMDALALAVAASILTPDTAPYVLTKAQAEATALAQAIAKINPDAVPELESIVTEEAEETKEEKKEEAEEKEEEEALGLADLFGG
ncbi:MAG: 50S ribosomal protein L10 [Candidatus Asgardarchaeia archaeon]